MPIKKSELYSTLWRGCDQLRGGMDASQYKDYILVLLFMKYVSDKYAGQSEGLLEVPAGGSFSDMVALSGDKEIGDKLNKIISRLAEANNLKGVIDQVDFNDPDKLGSGQDMVDRLSKLVLLFNDPNLNFKSNRAEGDDLLGDAYEYLMRNFATESGKSKGQFYTPAEVSRIMAKVIGAGSATRSDQTIYDPTAGSGSLLLKVHAEARAAAHLDLAVYGQEMDNATAALARMNMILHDCPTAEIWKDNTLSRPYFTQEHAKNNLKTFDFVVANPPFSTKAWTTGLKPSEDVYGRFAFGIPPAKNGDYAFLLHVLASLKSSGHGAIILPHGVLFRGNAEGDIRRQIVRRGYIQGIIGLPANLFYGTGIPACIIVLDKEHAAERDAIFMIDASQGFLKDGSKNRLRAQDIHKIVDTFTRQLETPRYARRVPLAEIEANDYNLNLPRYIDSSTPEDHQDIAAHLLGGIPDPDLAALAPYWQVLPNLRAALFAPANRPGYSRLTLAPAAVKSAIFTHPEFVAFNQSVTALFEGWKATHTPRLKALGIGARPKALIETLSEDLLQAFQSAPLLDPYAIYQHLLDYWEATMQDDVYLLAELGWCPLLDGKPNTDLIPRALVAARYFAPQQQALAQLEAGRDDLTRQREEMEEEYTGEDGILAELKNDKGKINLASIRARLAALKSDEDANAERDLALAYFALFEQEAAAARKLKDAQTALDATITARYPTLSADEIQTLVVDEKWLPALSAAVQSELERVSQTLTGRIKELAERYEAPLPEIVQEVANLSAKVYGHLRKMGGAWK